MQKILITGASGLLGTKLMTCLPRATGWRHRHDAPGSTAVDITDASAVDRAMDALCPALCVHCAADASVPSCENDPAAALRLNVGGTENVAAACERNQTRLILISTDYVFDGLRESYDEAAIPAPLNVYGRTKAAAEGIVLRNPSSLVIRIPLLFGYNGPKDKITWPREVCEKLRAGGSLAADHRELRQPTLLDDVAAVVAGLLHRDVTGILHVAAMQTLTKYDWAVMIARYLGWDESRVTASHSVPAGPRRPVRSKLNTDRLLRLGLPMPRTADITTRLVLNQYSQPA